MWIPPATLVMDDLLEEANAAENQEKGSLCQLPIARIKKIMKADKDVNQCSQEATFLVACATVTI